jgi:hypothetical protein
MSEAPAHTPHKPSELTVKKRRREKSLLFKLCPANKWFNKSAAILAEKVPAARGAKHLPDDFRVFVGATLTGTAISLIPRPKQDADNAPLHWAQCDVPALLSACIHSFLGGVPAAYCPHAS